jgi:hypothetical protein
VNALIEKQVTARGIPPHLLKQVYENTLSGSLLRRLFTDWSADKGDIQRITTPDVEDLWPRDALFDLIKALGTKVLACERAGQHKTPEERGKCHYHIHAQGESC